MATPLIDAALADTWVDAWLAQLRRWGITEQELERRARYLAQATLGSTGPAVQRTAEAFMRWYVASQACVAPAAACWRGNHQASMVNAEGAP